MWAIGQRSARHTRQRPRARRPDAPIPHALTSFSLSLSSQVAQLLTILRERTVAAGVSKRDARKAETKEKVAAGFGNM